MSDDDTYLVWSNEHQAWWGPGFNGYSRKLSQAGRYSRADALGICVRAMPGQADRESMLAEIPVRLEDVQEMQTRHREAFPGRPPESWE